MTKRGDELLNAPITVKEGAIICIFITEGILTRVFSEMKDPTTGQDVDADFILDAATIVDKLNIAMGNPPSQILQQAKKILSKKRTDDA